MIFNKLLIYFCFIVATFVFTTPLFAQTSISVSMQLGDPYGSLRVDGFAPPQSVVTFLFNSVVVGTATADSLGQFTKLFTSLDPEIIDVGIYYQAINGELSPTIHQQIAIIPESEIRMYDIVLPPTINGRFEKPEKRIYVHGWAAPSMQVIVFSEKPSDSYKASSNENGKWSLEIPLEGLKISKIKLYARSVDSLGRQSKQSDSITVTVKSDYISEVIQNIPDKRIRQVVERFFNPLSVLYSDFDLNKDGVITTDEAYNVVKSWTQSWRGKNTSCDLNNDGLCNIVDFSIMLFYIDRK